jgi:voltage-gated potassium channel
MIFKRFAWAVACRPGQTVLLFIALVLYSATGYMYFELPENPDLQWADAFWWTIVTMTTVGYGDLFPTTLAGRVLVGFPTMLLGVGILGYMLSLVATAMLESKIMEAKGMKTVHCTGHIVICNFVSAKKTGELIHELGRDRSTSDAEIVIIDADIDELPSDIVSETTHFVKGDPAREDILTRANVRESRAVIVQADPCRPGSSDNTNLKVGLTIENIDQAIHTVIECLDPENVVYFKRANCDSVVCIASLTGQMMVQELQDPGIGTVVSELTSNAHGKQLYIQDIKMPCADYAALTRRYGGDEVCMLLGVRRGGENLLLPADTFPITDGDEAILIAAGRPTTPAAG